MGSYAQGEAAMDTRVGALDDLDRQFERFDALLERLESILSPVLTNYASDKVLSEPHPEPASPFHARLERLGYQLNRLDATLQRVVL